MHTHTLPPPLPPSPSFTCLHTEDINTNSHLCAREHTHRNYVMKLNKRSTTVPLFGRFPPPTDYCCKPSRCKETFHGHSVYGQWLKEEMSLDKGVKGHN